MAHEGTAPSVELLQQIDRRAWAAARPNKPADIDETSWEATVREEIVAVDPAIVAP